MIRHIANIITGSRIVFSLFMLLFPAFSPAFYAAYILCGVSDMVDGTIARRTNSMSEFGARLDTAADFTFAAVSFIKLLPVVHVPGWLVIWILAIAVIKVCNVILGFILRKKFISLHIAMNKFTGLLLFLLPLTLPVLELTYSAVTVCLAATIASVQEGFYIQTNQEI